MSLRLIKVTTLECLTGDVFLSLCETLGFYQKMFNFQHFFSIWSKQIYLKGCIILLHLSNKLYMVHMHDGMRSYTITANF